MKPARDEGSCSSAEIGNVLAAVAVFLLVVFVYSSTLSCGFFADDYSYLHYFQTMTTGRPQLFWSNFTGLAFQEPLFGNHYRPLLTSALALLYLVAGTNAAVYHGVVLLLHGLNSVLVFCLARFVFCHFQIARPALCGFFAACLWSLYPQHAESLNWFAAGIDPFVSLFILLTFNIFFRTAVDRQSHRLLLPLAVVSFAVALGIKENSWSVPFILVLWCFFSRLDSKEARVKALSSTWMFFALLAAHLLIRYLALGTAGGGYFGLAQAGFLELVRRWSAPETLGMLLVPFNKSISPPDTEPTIFVLYLAAGVLLVCRALFWKAETGGIARLLCFCLCSWLVAILPVVRIWLPDAALSTGRLLYMPSIFSLITLVFLCGPLAATAEGNVIFRKLYSVLSVACLSGFVYCFGTICLADNALYLQASKDLSALNHELSRCTAAEDGSAVCVANFPGKCSGVPAHWFFCTAQASLSPPFVLCDQSARLAAMEPMLLADRDLVNAAVLKRMMASPAKYRLSVWRGGALNWIENLPDSADKAPCEIVFDPPKSAGLSTTYEKVLSVPINGADYDLAILHWRGVPHKDGASFSWHSAETEHRLAVYPGESPASVLHLDEIGSWTMAASIDKIKVETVGSGRPELAGVTLMRSASFVPRLAPPNDCELLAGCVYLKPGAGDRTMTFTFDASSMPEVESVLVEVLPPFCCHAAISGTYRDPAPSPASYYTFVVNSNRGKFELSSLRHSLSVWYQVRIFGRKADGTITGYASDPVSFQFCRQGVLGLK